MNRSRSSTTLTTRRNFCQRVRGRCSDIELGWFTWAGSDGRQSAASMVLRSRARQIRAVTGRRRDANGRRMAPTRAQVAGREQGGARSAGSIGAGSRVRFRTGDGKCASREEARSRKACPARRPARSRRREAPSSCPARPRHRSALPSRGEVPDSCRRVRVDRHGRGTRQLVVRPDRPSRVAGRRATHLKRSPVEVMRRGRTSCPRSNGMPLGQPAPSSTMRPVTELAQRSYMAGPTPMSGARLPRTAPSTATKI